MHILKKHFISSLFLPLALSVQLSAKGINETTCSLKSKGHKKVEGCRIDSSLERLDARSLILNRLNEASRQMSQNSISKENSIIAIERLVYAAGKITLTENEIKLTALDRELQISKRSKNLEIINQLLYRKEEIALTKEEIKLTQIDDELNEKKVAKKTPSSIVKTTKNFMLINVKKGDTLQSLASVYYGDKEAYQRIYKENKDKIGRDLKIFSNTILIIPKT
jgi:LysM repeat protein